MSEVGENKSDLNEADELTKEIESNTSTIINLLQEKLSDSYNYTIQISYIKENIKTINDLQHIDMLKSLKNNITEIKTQVAEINIDDIENNKDKIIDDIRILTASINSIFNLFYSYLVILKKTEAEITSYLKSAKNKAEEKISEIDKLKNILKDRTTYEIYQTAEKINGDKYNFYIYWSIGLMIGGLILSVFSRKIFVDCIKVFEYNSIDYWISKVGIIFIAVTGVTFCLKQAIHHQKKKDKAEQTRLELEALPTYMFNFSDEQKSEVYKELTGKYFGRDFDNEGYKDMANLIQEQIRLSHEVLKDTLLKNSNSNSKGS